MAGNLLSQRNSRHLFVLGFRKLHKQSCWISCPSQGLSISSGQGNHRGPNIWGLTSSYQNLALHFGNGILDMILEWICRTLQCFSKYQIFHILCGSSQVVDNMENKGCKLDQVLLILNDEPMVLHPIPWVDGLSTTFQKWFLALKKMRSRHQRVGLFG